ncbi:MAG: DNA-binding response regulator [Synechococcaceae bacterium WB9_2_112]|nr:DNA-binding response regulator [Synechococcaceae bacterium WB9_2_112]
MTSNLSGEGIRCTCLVVADHYLCGQAVGGLLSEQCGLELIAVSATVREALEIMNNESPPGLLVLDVVQLQGSWQEAAQTLQRLNPNGRLIMLKARNDDFVAPQEFQPMLLGVIEKSCSWDNLINLVARWQQIHPSPTLRRNAAALEQLQRLAPRELKVFYSLGKGMQNKEIAKSLGICVNTVETYRKTISAKLGLSGVELVRVAVLQRCTNLKV